MAPQTTEARLGELESDYARIEERVKALSSDVRELRETPTAIARLEEAMRSLARELAAAKESIGDVKTSISVRDRAATDERRALRTSLLILSGTIIAAIITAAGAIIASGQIG